MGLATAWGGGGRHWVRIGGERVGWGSKAGGGVCGLAGRWRRAEIRRDQGRSGEIRGRIHVEGPKPHPGYPRPSEVRSGGAGWAQGLGAGRVVAELAGCGRVWRGPGRRVRAWVS